MDEQSLNQMLDKLCDRIDGIFFLPLKRFYSVYVGSKIIHI